MGVYWLGACVQERQPPNTRKECSAFGALWQFRNGRCVRYESAVRRVAQTCGTAWWCLMFSLGDHRRQESRPTPTTKGQDIRFSENPFL